METDLIKVNFVTMTFNLGNSQSSRIIFLLGIISKCNITACLNSYQDLRWKRLHIKKVPTVSLTFDLVNTKLIVVRSNANKHVQHKGFIANVSNILGKNPFTIFTKVNIVTLTFDLDLGFPFYQFSKYKVNISHIIMKTNLHVKYTYITAFVINSSTDKEEKLFF